MRIRIVHLALLLCVLTSRDAWAQQKPAPTPPDLINLGLQDLMQIEVTSGATTLPEILRLAPNLEVGQVSASGYAISARGFNGSSANKLLVLIDGRSAYTPLVEDNRDDVELTLMAFTPAESKFSSACVRTAGRRGHRSSSSRPRMLPTAMPS